MATANYGLKVGAMSKKRVLSGMRPTGKLHLGHLHGTLKNWVKLQDEYECFFFVADWHALTSEYENTSVIKGSIQDVILDWLSVGIDPEKSTIFTQSKILEHAELHLLLSMIVPLPWLERNPTYKEQQDEMSNKDLTTYGFLGYPVLQAADIIMYKAGKVPVGQDQVPHLELTREIVRRFNNLYGKVFPEPEQLLTEIPKVLGLDRRKMSKSYGNAIYLSDSPEEIRDRISQMITDPQRKRKKDPGDPDVCNVFSFHKMYSSKDEIEMVNRECRKAGIGCVECKELMAGNLIVYLQPYREKRAYYLSHSGKVNEILAEGIKKTRSIAGQTMDEVRKAMGLE
jgi:tryptophanyl-tRNA synthetase